MEETMKNGSRGVLLLCAVVTVAAAVTAGGCAKKGAESPGTSGERNVLIPRRVLFGNPERSDLKVSPDGKYLSYLAPVDGVMNVWVAPAGDLSKARAVTAEKERGIRQHFWAYTSQHV